MLSHKQITPRQKMKTCSHTIRTHLDKKWEKMLSHNQNTPRQYMRENMFSHNQNTPRQEMREAFSHNQNTPRQEMKEHVLTLSEHTWTRYEKACFHGINKHLEIQEIKYSHTIKTHLAKRWETCFHTIRAHLDNNLENVFSHNQNTPRQEMGNKVFTKDQYT